eukprot:Rhum_TRINITY_DN15870_c0_g1::Rhum_TRINITY_DN15870_c0_g1_i1::g.162321::m.162321
MGVPSLFQWVFFRYPQAVKAVLKRREHCDERDAAIPPVVFDCLYFDLNSVIHNCCHGNDPLPEDATEEDMVLRIFEQIDEIIGFVKPTTLVYIAVDGVVPAGKLIQQRSRRLKTAEEQLRSDAKFDANSISPGTPFMHRLGDALRWYVYDRANNDDDIKKLSFILSDASVPGEGEHKIVDYVKEMKAQKDYDPNMSHCICSQDADLVLLGLLLHTPHASILREHQDVRAPRGKAARARDKDALKYDYVNLGTMREYLAADFSALISKKGATLESIIDDLVVAIGLMGNDFLPCIPSVSVREGALDELLLVYAHTYTGPLIEKDGATIHYSRLGQILNYYAAKEATVFVKRKASQVQRGWLEEEAFSFTQDDYARKYSAEKLAGQEMRVSADFLQGLKWCTDYYFTGNASWQWAYPHSYPPLVTSLARFCKQFHASTSHVYRGPPLRPLELLLAILPRKKNDTLPPSFRALTQEGGVLGDMFEDRHVVEKIGGRTLTITQSIDVKRLAVEVRKPEVLKLLSPEAVRLNTFGPCLAYVNTEVHPEFREVLTMDSDTKKRTHSEMDGGGPAAMPWTKVGLTGYDGPNPSRVPLGGEYTMEWKDLDLDPVDENKTACVVLGSLHVLRHVQDLLPNTVLPKSQMTATEAVMGSEAVFQSLVPPVF